MLVKLGNLFFHYRNYFFAIMYAALFLPSRELFPDLGTARIIGGIIIALGMLIRSITIGLVYIIRGGVNRQIHAETLVTEGIYKVCRNPMYLGNLLLLLGFGIFANSMLFTFIFFPLFIFIYIAIIKAEEAFLFNKFGSRFTDYLHRTNALIPRLDRLKDAFAGRRFNVKKVINKEYNSLFIYFEGMLLLLLYRDSIELTPFLICSAVLSIAYLVVKVLKRKKMLE
ncbi:MAG: methyltransferase family protein [Mangrovibacterium sp.]